MKAFLTILVSALIAGGVAFGVTLSNSDASKTDTQSFGSLSGPDISSPYLKWGSVATYNVGIPMKTATTTLCSIPITATSTIQSLAIQINTGTSTAANIDVATSTNAYATTTSQGLLLSQVVSGGARATFSYDPASNANIVSPGQYILVKTEQSPAGGFTYGGTCQLTYQPVAVY